MSYRFFRNSLIKVAILSVGVCGIFYDALTGKKVGSPAALILIAAFVVFGNGWLTYMMLKAKKREQQIVRSGDPLQAIKAIKPVIPTTRAQRKRQRAMFLAFVFAFSLVLIVMGFYGWSVNFIPAYYLGAFLLVFGIVGLCGVNIWKGGPLDPIHDPSVSEPQLLVESGEASTQGVWPPPPSRPSS